MCNNEEKYENEETINEKKCVKIVIEKLMKIMMKIEMKMKKWRVN